MDDNFAKCIYNTWLKYSRKGKPWQPRKDFSDFENDKNYVALMRLTSFFRTHNTVNVEYYIKAPYKVYKNTDETFYLDFYTGSRAAKAYNIYTENLMAEMPDDQLEIIVNSFIFIRQFCVNVNIKLEQYLDFKSGTISDFFIHLLQHNVSVYALFAFPEFDRRIKDITKEEMEFILGGEFANNLDVFKTRWQVSSKAKILSQQSYNKVKNLLEKSAPDTNI